MNKKERLVAAIEQGTVIDHIPTAKTYQVFFRRCTRNNEV